MTGPYLKCTPEICELRAKLKAGSCLKCSRKNGVVYKTIACLDLSVVLSNFNGDPTAATFFCHNTKGLPPGGKLITNAKPLYTVLSHTTEAPARELLLEVLRRKLY